MFLPLLSTWFVLFGMQISPAAAGDSGDDFSNNLFSDIAPLLALFGEKFAQQFMSESFGWLDHIIFAMAPLGIITAIVGAIRIGGPSWMRAIIGRARENRASAEVELMSSTSHEVCELWNGESVVRTLGRPLVKQIAVLRREMHNEETFGLYTLEKAHESKIMETKVYQGHSVLRWLEVWKPTAPLFRACSRVTRVLGLGKKKTSSWDVELGSGGEPSSGTGTGVNPRKAEKNPRETLTHTNSNQTGRNSNLEAAPNILLNLHHGSKTGDLVFAAISGIILQLGVLVFSGFVTYYGVIHPGVPEKQTRWGYPLLAIGTALLVVGMIIAAFVIEQSTVEAKWRVRAPEKDVDQDVQVLWLQKEHIVGDQSFNSFVLQAKEDCREVLTSKRSRTLEDSVSRDNASSVDRQRESWVKASILSMARTHTEVLSLVGTLLGLTGFILQFQGFRGVHWTCPLAQLAAIGVMTTLRAWVRRGLTVRPRADCVTSEHEMDWLADNMASRRTKFWSDNGGVNNSVYSLPLAMRSNPKFHASQNWTTTFAYRGLLDQPQLEEDFREYDERLGQRAVDIRRRLGALTEWTGPVTEPAAAAAAAIKKVMDTFVDRGNRFVWIMDMPLGGLVHQIRIVVNRDRNPSRGDEDGGGWKELSAEIEAVLSLWLFGIKNSSDETDGPEWRKRSAAGSGVRTRSRHILGPNINNCLELDVAWWINNEITPEERTEAYSEDISLTNNEIVVGYRGVRTHGKESLNTVPSSDKPITTLSVLSAAKLELVLAQHIFSGFMWSVAEHIASEDLARPITYDTKDAFDVYDHTTWKSCRLENPKLNALVREVQRTGIGSLEEASTFIIPPLSCFGKLPSESIVELIRQRVRDNETNGHWEESIQVYSELIKLIKGGVTIRLLYQAVAAVIEFLQIAQQSDIPSRLDESLNEIKKGLLDGIADLGYGQSLRDVTVDLRKLYKWQRRTEEYDRLFKDLLADDTIAAADDVDEDLSKERLLTRLFGYSRCHVALIQNNLGNEDWRPYMFSGDILGWTPLHYAALHNPTVYDKYARRLNISARLDPRDIAERTPLHYAAKAGGWHVGQSLRKHSNINARGRDGMLPLHWAAKCGNLVMAKMLIANDSKVDESDNCQKTPLYHAVEEGHEAVAQALLEAKADVNAKLKSGDTALHRASQLGHTRIVQALLDRGAGVNDKGKEGKTALHFACEEGHTETVRILLCKNVGVIHVSEYDDNTKTPLHNAADKGHPDIAKLLVDHGANINARNASQNTPLLSTAWSRQTGVAAVLLEAGADILPINRDGYHPILLSSNSPDMMEVLLRYSKGNPELEEHKRTALGWAEEEEVQPVVQMLQQDLSLAGKDHGRTELHKAADTGDVAKIRAFLDSGGADINVNVTCAKGNTPLILAAWRGRDAAVALLLEKGADPSHMNSAGQVSLHRASEAGRTGVVRQLLGHPACPDVNVRTNDSCSDTALCLAAWCGHLDTVALLLDRGADPLLFNFNNNNNGMHLAASRGYTDVVLRLLDYGADMMQENNSGWTALAWAAYNSNEKMVQAILKHPRNDEGLWQRYASVKDGKTPVHIAAEQGHPGTVALLLDAGADVNAVAVAGDSEMPLHLAAAKGHVEVAELLLERGARPDAVDSKGRLARNVAEENGHEALAGLLAMMEQNKGGSS